MTKDYWILSISVRRI